MRNAKTYRNTAKAIFGGADTKQGKIRNVIPCFYGT